jgi:hypothetical protein
MIGAQWMKHSPRVKFKDAVLGPHTARSDGGILLEHYYIPSFITLVEKNFYEYFKVRLKDILSITTINYNNKHSDLDYFGSESSKFEADLLNINYLTNLTTEEEVTSNHYKQMCSWIINFRTTNLQKGNFSLEILGPFRDQLTIEGKLINPNFLKPIEILKLIIRKLSLDKLIKLLINPNRRNDNPTQATIMLRNQLQTSIIKLLDLLFLEASTEAEESMNNPKETPKQIVKKKSYRKKEEKLSNNRELQNERKISENCKLSNGVIFKISGKYRRNVVQKKLF